MPCFHLEAPSSPADIIWMLIGAPGKQYSTCAEKEREEKFTVGKTVVLVLSLNVFHSDSYSTPRYFNEIKRDSSFRKTSLEEGGKSAEDQFI